MQITLKGKATQVSREQVRAFLHAAVAVLSYHNRPPLWPLVVRIKKQVIWKGRKWNGLHCEGRIELKADLSPEDMLTVCIHEVIHACIRFPKGTVEKNTSTLTARIKSDVARLAEILLENTYQRAAFLAHTKLAYRAKGGDHYDNDQYDSVGVSTKYHRKGE